MKVSTLLYMGATALFVAAGITELVERRAEAKTWQEATAEARLDGKGLSSSQQSAQPPPSQQST